MPHFIALPEDIAAVFGAAAPNFVDFLTSSFSLQKEDVIAVSATQFENRLTRETTGIRLEIAELRSETRTDIAELRAETQTAIAGVRTEIAELRAETQASIAEVRTEIAELRGETRAGIAGLRAEMKADFASVHKEISGLHGRIAGLHGEISGLHGQIAGLHGQISAQTRWMLVGLAAAVTLYPIITRLVGRLVP